MARKLKLTGSFFIGLFFLVALALFAAVVVWLGARRYSEESAKYATYFEGSVEGLEKGSPVKYLGVPVGSVEKIGVAPDGKLIEVIFRIKSDIKIDSSLRVKAELAGIAGGKFLQLSYPSSKEALNVHPKITFKPPYPVILSSPSGIEEIEIATREIINNLRKLDVEGISSGSVDFLKEATRFFKDQRLYEILDEIKKSAVKLNGLLTAADTSRILRNLTLSSDKLKSVSAKLDKFSDKLLAEIDSLKTSERLDKALAEYDSTLSAARLAISSLSYRAEQVMFTVNRTLEDLRSTNKRFKKTLRTLTENPSGLIFSEPPPEEK